MRKPGMWAVLVLTCLSPGLFVCQAWAEYRESPHRGPVPEDAVAVDRPGSFSRPGAVYMLTRDLSCATSAVFLGKDVTLDLNGYTISYADGGYEHVPNYGFEEGLRGWDTSRAPGTRLEDTDKVHIFIGKKILRLAAGDEIVSQYVSLPMARRSYFAICGVAITGMKVSLYVEDESGRRVRCENQWSNETLDSLELPYDFPPSFNYRGTRVSCPVENRTVRLGGGFVVAHLHGLPAGRYRIRVKAETDCLVDHIDIRPAMDVGIGIVEKTRPWAHNDFRYAGLHCAFYDYTAQGSSSEPVPSVPVVTGQGTVTIKNGTIRSSAVGVLSWGIQSTARDVKVLLDNVRVIASGINTNAVDIPQGELTDCRFEIDTPFIINRHKSEQAVVLRGAARSEVKGCEFIGGQGCLTIMGRKSLVHDNLFVNRQTVTNHYCVMVRGDSSKIYNNRFEPEIGSGLEIYVHKYIEVFNNSFRIEASPPTCEYGHEEYSVNGIRVADYRAVPGSLRSCAENRIYSNTFHITGKDYPQYPDYVPMAYAVFHSVSGGETYYYDNDIFVDQTSPGSKAEAAACYISGNNGGRWYNNRITTNIHAFWVASRYGGTEDAKIYNNTIIKARNAPRDFKPVRMGWAGRPGVIAQNIEFRSNVFERCGFDLDITDQDHSYSVYWTLKVTAVDTAGNPIPDAEVRILDRDGREVLRKMADKRGSLKVELLEYSATGRNRKKLSPYTVRVGEIEKTVVLDKNREVNFTIE